MYLGQSPVIDFLFCAGLGVAAVSCACTAALTARKFARTIASRFTVTVIGALNFLLYGGALLSIAAAIGETKSGRSPNSILGFAAGAAIVSIVFLVLRRGRS